MTEQKKLPDLTTEQIHEILAAKGCIASIWNIEDVQAVRPDLNDEQSLEVLQACEHYHDAEIGINWNVIRCHADMLFPEPLESEAA